MLGNLLFLNLFLSIILDAFTNNDNTKEKVDTEVERLGSIFSITELRAESQRKNHPEDIKRYCEKSLCIFSRENMFRLVCFRFTRSDNFESLILFFIFLSSLKLCIDTYFVWSSDYIYFANYLDLGLNIAFAIEFFLKIVSFGFYGNNNSYLNESWNKLDFFLVAISLIDIIITDVNLSIMKIFRLLRILRPLRLLTRNQNMRLIVNAMLMSFEAIFDVLLVVFAIL
jgi:hypothetical protein